MIRRNYFKILGAVGISGLSAFLFYQSSFFKGDELQMAFGHIDYRYTVAAFICYIGISLVRAMRFKVLLEGALPLRSLVPIVFLQNFFNTFLPFRMGEFSFIYLVHKTHATDIGKNISSLITARYLDFTATVFVLVLSIVMIGPRLLNFDQWFIVSGGVFFIFIVGLILFLRVGIFLESWMVRFVPQSWKKNWVVIKILDLLHRVIQGLSELSKGKLLVRTILFSFFAAFFLNLLAFFLFRSIGSNLTYWESAFVYSLPVFLSLTPIYGFAGVGGYEGSISYGLAFLGTSFSLGIVSGVALHVQEIIFTVVIGCAGLCLNYFWKEKRSEHKPLTL